MTYRYTTMAVQGINNSRFIVAQTIQLHEQIIPVTKYGIHYSEVMEIPTSKTLPEEVARAYFRDAVLGLEYREFYRLRSIHVFRLSS